MNPASVPPLAFKRPLPRAFAGARGVLIALAFLLACGGWSSAMFRNHYIMAVGSTVALLVCAWEAHVRIVRKSGASKPPLVAIVLYTLWNIFALVTFALALFIFAMAFFPGGQTNRDKVRPMFGRTTDAKTEITRRVRAGIPLAGAGQGISIPLGQGIELSRVTSDGVITVAGSNPPAIVQLTPVLKPGRAGEPPELVWTCIGSPARHMPAGCQ